MTAPLLLAAGSVLDVDAFEVVDAAAAAGFAGVGLRLSDHHRVPLVEIDRLRRHCADAGIVVHDVEVFRITASTRDRDRSLDALVEAAAAVGARSLLVVSDLADRAATEDRLGAIVAVCRRAGLCVGLEYMAWTTPSDPGGAVRMAEATGAVVVVDVLHHHRLGCGAAELAEVVRSGRLGWVQLCDAPASPPVDLVHEARHERLVPGEGALPLHALVQVLPADTPISVEVQSDRLSSSWPPADRARVLLRATRSVLGHRR